MDFISVPIIVVCCYIVGELFKLVFKNKQEAYNYIPIITAVMGGALGILIFYTNPEIKMAQNPWSALGMGIISGSSATGTNQIIKQLFKSKKINNKEDIKNE